MLRARSGRRQRSDAGTHHLEGGLPSRSTRGLSTQVLLGQLDLVEEHLFRLSKPLRAKFKAIVLNWRKHLGYSALSSATAGFDKPTLLKLQELFAELDEDGSGYLDAHELGALFRRIRAPMSKQQLEDIVDEIDVDGAPSGRETHDAAPSRGVPSDGPALGRIRAAAPPRPAAPRKLRVAAPPRLGPSDEPASAPPPRPGPSDEPASAAQATARSTSRSFCSS